MTALDFPRRHPLLTAQYVGVAGGAAMLAWYGQTLGALVWAGTLAGMIALDVLRSRIGTQLNRRTARAMLDAIRAHPPRSVLLDNDTGDVFIPFVRRVLGGRVWTVQRCPGGFDAVNEAMSELNCGAPASTVACTDYVLSGRRLSSFDRVAVVRLGPDGEDLVTEPQGRFWRDMRFRIRSGSPRMTDGEVAELLAQLRRAEVLR